MNRLETAALNVLTIAILGSAAACSDATGPAGDPGPEPPEARFETVYDVTLVPRYVRISSKGACDGDDILGNPRNGEFQYRVEGFRNGARQEALGSSGYNSVTGRAYSRGPSETINFANETWRFDNLRIGDQVELKLRTTEWDLTSRDSYLNDMDASAYFNVTANMRVGSVTDADIFVGASSCGMRLVYDRSVTSREVRAG